MSGTLGVSRVVVRRLINDLPVGGDPMVGDERLTAIISSVSAQVGAILGLADTWTTSAVTLVPGQREYALPGSQYQGISIVRRTEDGRILSKRSMLELESRYQNTDAFAGLPTEYTLYEDATGTARIRIYPTPTTAGHLDTFTTVSATALSAPGDSIPYSRLGVQAVELLSAADCILGLDEETMAKKHVTPALAQRLTERGMMMLDMEKERRAQFRRQDTVRRVRY